MVCMREVVYVGVRRVLLRRMVFGGVDVRSGGRESVIWEGDIERMVESSGMVRRPRWVSRWERIMEERCWEVM